MLTPMVAGGVVFPGLFLLSKNTLQRLPQLRWEEADAVIVSARLVSSVQAVMASTAGYIVSTSCKHIIDDQHWLSSAYTQFAVPYFIYDIYAMFLCHWHKHQVKGHGGDEGSTRAPGSTWAVARGYLHKEFLMVLHHAVMVLVCFPLSVVWRQGKGDFFLGCLLMAEVSTPFVCLGKILIQGCFMRGRRGDRMAINIQEHMAINVCPGPIRPIRQISDYFPRRGPGLEVGGGGFGEAPAHLAPLALAPPAALLGATTPEEGAEVDSYDSDDTSESRGFKGPGHSWGPPGWWEGPGLCWGWGGGGH
uniref:TLC domain-containing protein n=1 Tax=Capra hircus TaxID=9925 RepID=A0A8C2S7A0_CAPHI